VSHRRTIFENLLNDFRVKPAYGKNKSTYKIKLCASILFKKIPYHPKLWYLFYHSLGLPYTLFYAGLDPCQVRGRTGTEWAGVEWNYSGIEGFDNKMRNNLGLSSCAVPRSTVACVVAYFRRKELLSGISERSGIN